MTLRATWVCSALLLAVPSFYAAVAAQNAPLAGPAVDMRSVAQACADLVDGTVTGLPQLEQRCPSLPAALQAAGVRPLIIDSSRALFDRDSLRHLAVLMRSPMGPMPAVSALTPILRQLHGTTAPPRSWWERLWDWVLEHFAPKQQEGSSNSWLANIARLLHSAQWLWRAMIWITVISLPIAVVIIVLREVRAMGKRSTDEPSAGGASAGSGRHDSRLALLRRMPPGQRPAELFAMLIARLVAAGRLPPDRSLTHREVVRRALLDDVDQRRLVESLARLSERQLYASVATAPVELEDTLARGEDLYTIGWSEPLVRS
ncbi:MAG TPA: hypothetical protein VGG49_10815 [Steroidobacteraceae bacterium]|jgi:hypothetical protein